MDGGDKFNLTRDFMTMRRIGVMQEFTSSEKRGLKRERFEREAEKSLAEKEAATAAIQRDTAMAWLDRYYLEAMAAVASEQVLAAQAEVDSADSAYRAARGGRADVFAARAALAAARDRGADLQRRARGAAIDLARWIGEPTGVSLGVPPDSGTVRLREESSRCICPPTRRSWRSKGRPRSPNPRRGLPVRAGIPTGLGRPRSSNAARRTRT